MGLACNVILQSKVTMQDPIATALVLRVSNKKGKNEIKQNTKEKLKLESTGELNMQVHLE